MAAMQRGRDGSNVSCQDWRLPQCCTLRKLKEFQKRFDCMNKHSSGNISFLTLFLDFQMLFVLGRDCLFMYFT